ILSDQKQRWVRVLHWLAWSGGPMSVERITWDGRLVFEYDKAERYAAQFNIPLSGPPRYSFDSPDCPYNHFFSVFDNLFVRSSAASEGLAGTLHENRTPAPTRQGRGRRAVAGRGRAGRRGHPRRLYARAADAAEGEAHLRRPALQPGRRLRPAPRRQDEPGRL